MLGVDMGIRIMAEICELNEIWESAHSDAFHPGSRDDCGQCQAMIRLHGPMPPSPLIEFMAKRPGVGIQIIKRDGFGCRHCGVIDDLSYDHIKPKVKGGGDDVGNLQMLCKPCNSRKGSQ